MDLCVFVDVFDLLGLSKDEFWNIVDVVLVSFF